MLDKFLGRSGNEIGQDREDELKEEESLALKDAELKGEEAPDSCQHKVLMPRWNALEDMGKIDKVAGYRCDGCGRDLTLEEARATLEQGALVMGA